MPIRDALRHRARRSRKIPGVAKILTGTAIGQGSVLLVSPLLTRLYSPQDFAALAIVTAIVSVAASVMTLGWESAVPIPKDDNTAGELTFLAMLSALVLGTVLGVVAYTFQRQLAETFNSTFLTQYWWVMPATAIAVSFYFALSSWFVRRGAYGILGRRNAIQGLTQAIWSLGLGYAGMLSFGLGSSLGAGRLAGIVGLGLGGLTATWRGGRAFASRLTSTAKRYRRFPLITPWARVFNALGLQVPVLLMGALYGSISLGLFALSMRVLAAPVGMVSDAASQYFEGTYSSQLRGQHGSLSRTIGAISLRLFLVGLIPTLLILAFAPSIYSFVFGEEWADAGAFASIIVVTYLAQLAVSPVSKTLNLLELQGIQLCWDAGRFLVVALALIIPWLFAAPIETALLALTVTQVCAYAVMLLLVLTASVKRQRTWTQLRPTLQPGSGL